MQGNESISHRLNQLLQAESLPLLGQQECDSFEEYLNLLLKWNAKTNLTAIRDVEGILKRHFLESIVCARNLPEGIHSLLDFGSGAGFPGLPIVICRPDLVVTLAESQGKKAAFLQEAVRVLNLSVQVHGKRAEELKTKFDCVVLRAVDRMEAAMQTASRLVNAGGWIVPMTSRGEAESIRGSVMDGVVWSDPLPLAGGENQVLLQGRMFHVEQ
jgi:16S rRNA (guanine527-N7)-methyltransferase